MVAQSDISPKVKNQGTSKNIQIQPKPKPSGWILSPLVQSLMSVAHLGSKELVQPHLSRSVTWNAQSFYNSSPPYQIFHSLAISNVLKYLLQLKFHLHSFVHVSWSHCTGLLNMPHGASHPLSVMPSILHFSWPHNNTIWIVLPFPNPASRLMYTLAHWIPAVLASMCWLQEKIFYCPKEAH